MLLKCEKLWNKEIVVCLKSEKQPTDFNNHYKKTVLKNKVLYKAVYLVLIYHFGTK
jgi:RNase P/RNase MRP subunit p30